MKKIIYQIILKTALNININADSIEPKNSKESISTNINYLRNTAIRTIEYSQNKLAEYNQESAIPTEQRIE